MKRQVALLVCLILATGKAATAQSGDSAPLADVRRVVFLGDSITYAGHYIEFAEAILRVQDPAWRCEFLDMGLPSETVSGLSEPGHAAGQFPRPDLHERLERVLSQTKPDLVVACYGMNDGIYYPFSDDRFEKYQDGIERLRDRAKAHGAKVLHLTPPVFDAEPIKEKTLPAGQAEYRQPYVGYDEVLGRYSEWLLARRADDWNVVDIHGPMRQLLMRERERDPAYRLADDGVHINALGHWIIARALLSHWGVSRGKLADSSSAESYLAEFPKGLNVLKIVQERQRVLKDAWLTATGHKRPGMNRGVPLEEAERKARELDGQIRDLFRRP